MASVAIGELSLVVVVARQSTFNRPLLSLSTAIHTTPTPTSFNKLTADLSFTHGFGYSAIHKHKRWAVRDFTAPLTSAHRLRFAIVIARFNDLITKKLLEGALDTFKRYSVTEEDIDVVWVPGCFEIAVAAQQLGKSQNYHSILCIGAVIRGDTSHYDAVVNATTSGVLSAGLNSGTPCIFDVLTCDTLEQAFDRAGGKAGNKGAEAALTAIEMASLFEHHLKQLE